MPLKSDLPIPPGSEPFSITLVYATENPTWEYKVLARSLDDLPGADELNALGRDGWELAGTVSAAEQVYYYFKRLGK